MSVDIINYGSINIDHIYRVQHFVRPGETLASQSLTTVLGGKGANQSVAVARAGGKIAHVGAIGEAEQWALSELCASGVDVSGVEVLSGASGHAIIQVDEAGENSIILHGGANQKCDDQLLAKAIQSAPDARFLLLQNECNSIEKAIEIGHKQGLSIIYNPAPMNKQTLKLPLQLVDVLIVNQVEGQALSGERSPHTIVETLAKRYRNKIIVMTLGAKGAIMKTTDVYSVKALKAQVVDTTAAGDTFVGYFAAGLAEQLDPVVNLQRATKAAARAVTKLGAIPSIPLLAQLSESNDLQSNN